MVFIWMFYILFAENF